MNFASLTFWVALVGGFAVLSLVRLFFGNSERFDRAAFVGLSLFLLGVESLETVAIFGWVALVGYGGLFCRSRGLLWVVGILMLAPLTYYKYSGFLTEVFSGERPAAHALIPMGISFYSFQILSFVIDSFREGEERPRVVDYLNFASFFPQIVAGPIERRKDLLPQVKGLKFALRREAVEVGIPWIVLGLFLKLALAENFALLDREMRSVAVNAVQVWLEAGFFAFRIYFDFAGYSFIALGLARCFGIRLTLNFRSPYLARNLQDFWRQWHVTLSRWFRDYLFIPMGGSRVKFWGVNLMVVFLVSGLWHGAGWNFLIWGGLHGAGVWLCVMMGERKMPTIVSWGITMTFVMLSWIFFKESEWSVASQKTRMVFSPGNYGLNPSAILGVFQDPKTVILAVIVVGLSVVVMAGEWWSRRSGELYGVFMNRWVQLLLIAGIFFLSPSEESRFIYFNF
tara:strand:+ start:3802 stop:5163 length:1362 start_codon:yes stop_codon:yes gene_type:complete